MSSIEERMLSDEEREQMLRQKTRELRKKTRDQNYANKEKLRKSAALRTVLFSITMVFVLIAGIRLYIVSYPFHSYKLDYEVNFTGLSSAKLYGYRNGTVAVGKDSITYFEREKVVWTSSVTMQDPIVTVNGDYFSVYDRNAYQVMICDQTGIISTIRVTRQVMDMDLTAAGVSAVFTENHESAYISYFDRFGNRIDVEVKTILEASGYPLDVAVSPDGQKLAVVYYSTVNGIGESRLVLYHFGRGKSENQYIVFEESDFYDTDTMLIDAEFLDNDHLAAVGNNRLVFLSDLDRNVNSRSVEVKQNILKFFTTDSLVGLLVQEEEGQACLFYTGNGEKEDHFPCPDTYTFTTADDNGILFVNGADLTYYSRAGEKRYSGTMVQDVVSAVLLNSREMLLNNGDVVRKITLK